MNVIFGIDILAISWSLIESKKKVSTLLWMAGGWIIAILLSLTEAAIRQNGKAVADLWFIPSFAVPAIVGVIHARRTRRIRN